MVFIDADKENYKNYYDNSLDLINKDGLIIIDNVLWHGEVVDKTKMINLLTQLEILILMSKLIKKLNKSFYHLVMDLWFVENYNV